MNILSLFDGMSCGQLALQKAGVPYTNYFASEIEESSMQVTQHHFPNTQQLGSVTELLPDHLPDIDVLIGGSPCQDFSKILVDGKGIHGEKSGLFYEYVRLLNGCKPKFFLLENVCMAKESEELITRELGVEPVAINSSLFCAQSRPRLYWTNIPIPKLPSSCDLVLRDIMESNPDEKLFYDKPYEYHESGTVAATIKLNTHEMNCRVYRESSKCPTLTAIGGGYHEKKVFHDGKCRKLSPLEYERLQTVPDNFTKVGRLSDSKRRSMLGNGWTVDVIAHIFKGLQV